MRVIRAKDYLDASRKTANVISAQVILKPDSVLGLATGKKVWYKLALSWGVHPVLTEQFPNMEVLSFYAVRLAKTELCLKNGDTVVITGGNTSGASGNTNVLRIETIA